MTHEELEFTPDPKLQALAIHFAGTAVKYLRVKFQKNADYSDASVAEVEAALTLLWFHISGVGSRRDTSLESVSAVKSNHATALPGGL